MGRKSTNQTNILTNSFIMPPTLEKLKGHIALGVYVRPSVRPYTFQDRVLKFHRCIPHQKITDPNFFNF